MKSRPARALALLCLVALLGAAPADPTLNAATATVATLHARLGRGYKPLMARAKAILIAPTNTAPAILLIHSLTGWSEPAFFTAGALNTASPAILLIMSDRALDAILRQRGLPLTGPDALTLAPLRTRGTTGAELLLWSDGKPQLNDAGPTQDDDANTSWYGHPRNAAEIVGGTPPSLRTSKLRNAL